MIKLAEHKEYTQDQSIQSLPAPSRVYLPLSQHLGKHCLPEVKAGDTVNLGQRIAGIQAHVWAPVHASVSGKVAGIQDWAHPVLSRCKAIVIENDGEDRVVAGLKQRSKEEVRSLSPEQVRAIALEAGIVGMGGATFPAHVKLNPPKPIDTLIINGAECEPYLTSDSRLMVEYHYQLLLGIEAVAACLGVKNVYVGIEENKPDAIKAMRAQLRDNGWHLRVLSSRYPQGGEKQLIKNVLSREVPRGKLPFDVGVVVHNVATVFALYEALYFSKPLYERLVTVTGSLFEHPKNLRVRLGTPIKELIAYCGPLREEPAKIIMGGPMMGIAQYSDDVPVIKSSGGVLLLSGDEARQLSEEPCIRCGACVRECPVGLMPTSIDLCGRAELWQQAKEYGALDCIECGVCSYVCPAGRNLVQSIKRAKLEAVK
ncbi:MAG: electron transport complex subunit RsxC [Candidatus Omnitrophica bacterium]|nr:electron transport complex subunit RsxC [Candidatus Omnitrophota bacterium]